MGWGQGIGIGWPNATAGGFIGVLISSFVKRVNTAGGTIVNINCLRLALRYLQSIGILNKTSYMVTPTAYNLNTLYAVIPEANPLDMQFTRNSSGTYRNSNGNLATIGIGYPRLNFQESTSTCPTVLMEPQKTNTALNSDFPATSFYTSQSNIDVIPVNSINPKGLEGTIQKITPTISTGDVVHYIRAIKTGKTIGNAYTVSFFVQAAEYSTLVFSADGTSNLVFVDLAEGSITSGIGTIEEWKNGWYRVSATAIATSTTLTSYIYPNTNEPFTGNNSASIWVWGVQSETNPFATSYISTLSASVTRTAEFLDQLSLGTSVIGQSNGVIFIEGNLFFDYQQNISITLSNGTVGNRLQLQFQNLGTNIFNVFATRNSVQQAVGLSHTFTMTDPFKIAVNYSPGQYDLWINGVNVISLAGDTWDGTGSAQLNQLHFATANGAAQHFDGNIKSFQLYNTSLTAQELQDLTTL